MRETVKTDQLVAGDTIDFDFEGGFGIAVITKVEGDLAHYERTYAHISDFETTAGVGVTYNVERGTLNRSYAAPITRIAKSRVGEHWAKVQAERQGFLDEIERLKVRVITLGRERNEYAATIAKQDGQIKLLAVQAAKVEAEGRERAAELGAEVGKLQDKLTEAVEDLDSKQTTIRTMRERIYELVSVTRGSDGRICETEPSTPALAEFVRWVAEGSYTDNREHVADITDRARELNRRSEVSHG
jgi:hypothetical protein